MKISLNWLQEYLTIHQSPATIGDILTSTGLELEGLEVVESLPGGLRGVVVGHVLTCAKHPDADRLSITTVDVGEAEPLSIVCGAPNVAAGQKVLVATVGTTLYPNGSEGEPLTIKKGKIRGQVSAGMICAADELGIGDDHSGILVLPDHTPVGRTAADYFDLHTDHVFEIGLTPNRSDATNHLGVAHDLAAALRINHGGDGHVDWPSVEDFAVASKEYAVKVEVRDPAACPRYSGVVVDQLTVAESPDWLKYRLRAIGVRPINNVVDITNFVLHETGQPLHAFDLAQVNNQHIIVDTLPEGTSFVTLDEQERKLSSEDLMICDGTGRGLCIAGVFGGIGSGVSTGTTAIFLESAHFAAQSVRRTSMRHNLRTDAARIFEKGSDPNLTVYALRRAALLLQEIAGGRIASDIVDIYPSVVVPVQVPVRYQRINQLIGTVIPPEQVHIILEAMGMEIMEQTADAFTVAVPTNKVEVTREVDVIEEVLRIYGLNNVPMDAHIRTAVVLAPDPDPVRLREQIGDLLAANGFHEMMALSLSESRYYTEAATVEEQHLVYVNNTSNVHLDIMRPTMYYGGLEAIVRNQNRQEHQLRLYEFGRTYVQRDDAYQEDNHLALWMSGAHQAESWHQQGEQPTTFFTLKAYVQLVLDRLGITGYQIREVTDDPWAFGLLYHRGTQKLVELGQLSRSISASMGIKEAVLYADFQWDHLLRALPKQRVQFAELSKFPSVRRDLALVVEKSVKFGDIAAIASKVGKQLLQQVNLFDVYENDEQLGSGKKSYAVSFLFQHTDKTLKDQEVDATMEKLMQEYSTQLGAHIRR